MKLSTDISAVVTGGASGLGEATARALAAKGVKVGIFDMNEARGKDVAAEIGGVFAKVNVAEEASVDAGFDHVRKVNGTERILVITRIRSVPFTLRTWSNPASTLASSATFTLAKTPPISAATSFPRASFMSKIPTLTPLAAKARAVASPSPDAPPVTTALMSVDSFILVSAV